MKVNISVDPQDVEARVMQMDRENFVDYGRVDAPLGDVIQATIESLEFSFDRSDAELGEVIQFPAQ